MAHIVTGQFSPTLAHRLRRVPPSLQTRVLLAQLVNDLQLLAEARPAALHVFATLACHLTAPIRRRLARRVTGRNERGRP